MISLAGQEMLQNEATKSLLILLSTLLAASSCVRRSPSTVTRTVPAPPPISAPVKPNPQLPPPRPNGACRIDGELPDPACTPGVASPLVTQANIQQTICTAGYSAKIRAQYAPATYTGALKRLQIKEYGYTDTNPADYEEDHLISLELGGHPNDPRNLWPEPGGSPNRKDSIENLLHQRVCSGQMTLLDAQRAIATNWKAVQ